VPPANVGFVTIPDGRRTASGVMVSGLLDTLSPGSVLIEDDPLAGTWTIHSIDASDPQKTVSELERFYEHYQRPVWP
jgi:multisubunit Na+/H+ antiporter MnhE subunit